MWGPPYGYAPPFPASPYGNASPYAVAQPSYGSNPQYGPSPVPVYPAPSHGPPTSSSETTNYPIISNTPSKEVEYATAGTAALGTPVQPSPRVVPVPMAMPPAGGPQKKAVLVGCSYRGTSSELRGCTNDIQCMAHALQRHFGFTDRYILMLRDDGVEKSPDLKSTRYNIFRGIQWLLADMQPGSSLVFHFSGHGSQQRCRTGDELDGMDETICPSDFMSAGQIIDNELNQYLVRPLLHGVNLHCVIDACHSGTVMDLPFTTEYNPYTRSFGWRQDPLSFKITSGGTAVQFGACRDNQVAQDTSSLSRGTYTGAATFSFIQALETWGPRQTYAQLLGNMTTTLNRATANGNANASASQGLGGVDSLFGMFLNGSAQAREPQIPVLSCDKPLYLGAQLML